MRAFRVIAILGLVGSLATVAASPVSAKKPPPKKSAPFDTSITYDDVVAALAAGGIANCPVDPVVDGGGPSMSAGPSYESRVWSVVTGHPCPAPDQYGYFPFDGYDGFVGAVAYSSKKLRDQTAKGLRGSPVGFLIGYSFGRYIVLLESSARPELIPVFVEAMRAQPKARLGFDNR